MNRYSGQLLQLKAETVEVYSSGPVSHFDMLIWVGLYECNQA